MTRNNRIALLAALLGASMAVIGLVAANEGDDAPWWQIGGPEDPPGSMEDPPYEDAAALENPDWAPREAGQVIVESQVQLQKSGPHDATLRGNIARMRQQGYIDVASERARRLLMLAQGPAEQAARGLRRDTSGMKLAFERKAARAIPPASLIGYEPAGMETAGGWTGLSTVFLDSMHGACVYTVTHIGLTGGYVRLGAETTEYSVHGKPTQVTVEGSPSTGFAYEVAWFEPGVNHELTCALRAFDREHSRRLIALARRLDAGTP